MSGRCNESVHNVARDGMTMNKKTLTTAALLAALLALVGGVWGLVDSVDGANTANIEETFRWIAMDLVLLAICGICLALAAREP